MPHDPGKSVILHLLSLLAHELLTTTLYKKGLRIKPKEEKRV